METRARVWDDGNQRWYPKCPNFLVCRGPVFPCHTECMDCDMGNGVPHTCVVVAASVNCCICLEEEEAHLLLPCGHKVGAKCARKTLFAEWRDTLPPYFWARVFDRDERGLPPVDDITPQDFGCPPTDHLDDEAAEAVEAQWRQEHEEDNDEYNRALDEFEEIEENYRQGIRKKLATCPLCRAPVPGLP